MKPPPDLSYFEIAAQIIPVLFIALAFEAKRFFGDPLNDEEALELYRRRAGIPATPSEEWNRLTEWFTGYYESQPEERQQQIQEELGAVIDKADKDRSEGVAAIKKRSAAVVAVVSLLAMFLLVVGEAVAISVVASQNPTGFKMAVVAVAIAAGGYLIVLPLVQRQILHLGQHWPSLTTYQGQVSMYVTGLIVIVPTIVLWPG